ncbi:unnamed protein product [Orchesella dallaii]|uniref:C2H2-type domain-containing protein n=1 Tax=Orchesella dallaii TaxID=48710 RepID=A0ABP1PN78_9HEXA
MAQLNSSQIELTNCLFCIDQLVKYEIRDDEGDSSCTPNWKLLCDYVIGKSLHMNSFCSFMESTKCLCIDCYEMVVKLTKLHEEIEEVSLKLRCVIQRNESSLGSENVLRTSLRPPRRQKSGAADKNKSDSCKQLVNRFKDLVRRTRDVNVEVEDQLKDSEREQEPGSEITCTVVEGVTTVVNIKTERVKRQTIIAVAPETSSRSRNSKLRQNIKNPCKKAVQSEIKLEVETAANVSHEVQESLGHADEADNIGESELETEVSVCSDESKKDTDHSDNEDDDWSPEDESVSKKRKNINCTPASTSKRRRKVRKGYTCIQCGKYFDYAKEYMAHRSEHSKVFNAAFTEYFETVCEKTDDNNTSQTFKKCKMCDFVIRTKGIKSLTKHMFSHEEDAPPTQGPNGEIIKYPCNWCPDEFILKINLDFHKKVAHDSSQIRLKCDICSDVDYGTRKDLIDHLKLHTDKVHSCKSCSMSYTTLDRLLLHMVKHNPSKRLHCPECSVMPFNSINKLYKHCADDHRDLKEMFDCPSCDQSFVTFQFLNKHIKKVHRAFDTNGETCPRCTDGQLFYTQEMLDKHFKKEHKWKSKRQFQCDQCERTFGMVRELKVHILKHHEGVRFPCPHCPKSYRDRHSLDSHLKIHTGEGLFRCLECGKEFTKKNPWTKHMAVHKELPKNPTCVCEICGKKLYSDSQLTTHMRSHKEKKHECPYCNMKFNRLEHLRSHSRIHTGDRPFECEVCKKGFNRKDIMRVHMKGVHGITVKTNVNEYKKTKQST